MFRQSPRKHIITAAVLSAVIAFYSACGAHAENRLVIPPHVSTIQEATFENVPLQDTEIIFPDSLKRIESRAFAGTGIQKLLLSSRISYIADDAFDGCDEFHPTVYPGTYAADWCTDHGVTPYVMRGLALQKEQKVKSGSISRSTRWT